MLSNESGGIPRFDLPEELLEVLPADPFDQLDVARKITSIALATRVGALESEAAALHHQLRQRDAIIADLESQLMSLDASLAETAHKLAALQKEKESLLRENSDLSSNVKKLNRDVAKLETFRKKLMQSLQDDEDNPASMSAAPRVTTFAEDDGESLNAEDTDSDAMRPHVVQSLLIGSQTSTPRLTPPSSPPRLSASVSPSRTPNPGSPRRHSSSFSATRRMFDDKSSGLSSVPSSLSSTSSFDSGSQSGKTHVDGKEFFRQVRNRLSLEQFGTFLANVKELNSNKQTKEDTLQKADEIFGPDNRDLYAIFEGLLTRNLH